MKIKNHKVLLWMFFSFINLITLTYAATSLNSCTTISSPGVYYLTSDITDSSSTCFTISSSDVTLDCQWHVIDGTKASGSYGIYASGSLSNITIRNCKIQEFYHGIYLRDGVHDSKIENVVSNSNNYYGIRLSSSSSNTLTNIIANNNGDTGIRIDGSSFNIFVNITANNNNYGVYFCYSSSSFNTIANSTISHNNQYGLGLEDGSDNNITSTTITFNAQGIYLKNSDNNLFKNNTIIRNKINDIRITSGDNNLFYNNLLSSKYKISDESSTTKWNYTNIGNHWLAYDAEHEGCYDTNNDNICDNPYAINNKYDYYPIYTGTPQKTFTCSSCSECTSIIQNNATPNDIVQLTVDIINFTTSKCIYFDPYTYPEITFDCQNHLIDGDDNADYGIYIDYGYGHVIKNCQLTDWDSANIYLTNAKYNTLENIITKSSPDYGIWLDSYSSFNTLINITAKENSYDGVYIYWYSSFNTLINITAKENRYGIRFSRSSLNTITDILVNNNNWGLVLSCSSSNTIINITANHNGGIGIYLSGSSNTLTNIIANSNSGEGIYFSSSSSNTLTNITANSNNRGICLYSSSSNIIANSTIKYSAQYGIYLSSSDNNLFYNNLLNNTNNIYISSSSNQWNTTLQLGPNIVGRPFIGGNVYATPSGNGYSETCNDTNHDGICDSPYTLAPGNIDYYPLALSKTYPLNPKIYVGEQLVWKYNGFFNDTTQTYLVNILNAVKKYISTKCGNVFPCTVPIKATADSRGSIRILRHGEEGYKVIIENIMTETAEITNITIYNKQLKPVCSTNLSKKYILPPGGIGIFKILCKDLFCSDIEDIIVETTCGVKDKLSLHPVIKRKIIC